jgi:hypothetical protein
VVAGRAEDAHAPDLHPANHTVNQRKRKRGNIVDRGPRNKYYIDDRYNMGGGHDKMVPG